MSLHFLQPMSDAAKNYQLWVLVSKVLQKILPLQAVAQLLKKYFNSNDWICKHQSSTEKRGCVQKNIYFMNILISEMIHNAGGEETIYIQSLSNASQKTLFTLSWSGSAASPLSSYKTVFSEWRHVIKHVQRQTSNELNYHFDHFTCKIPSFVIQHLNC